MSYSRSEVGWKWWANTELICLSALQFGDQRVARGIDPGRQAGGAAGIGMDFRDQPAVRGADIVYARILADAEQGAGFGRTHGACRRHALAPPHIDEDG